MMNGTKTVLNGIIKGTNRKHLIVNTFIILTTYYLF